MHREPEPRLVELLEAMCRRLHLDPEHMTPMRGVVRYMGEALVESIQIGRAHGHPNEAQIVACECVVAMETKDHALWELLAMCADEIADESVQQALKDTCRLVLEDEDRHLSHVRGWQRELWIRQLAALG